MLLQALSVAIYLKVYNDAQETDNRVIQLQGFGKGWESLGLSIECVNRELGAQGCVGHEADFSYSIVKKYLIRTGAEITSSEEHGGLGLVFSAEERGHTFRKTETARCVRAPGRQA